MCFASSTTTSSIDIGFALSAWLESIPKEEYSPYILCKAYHFNDSGFAGSIGTGTSDGDHILGRHRLLMTYPSIRGDVENGAIISDKRQLYLHRFRNILFWCLCESCLCEESGCNGQGNEFHNMLIPF